VRRSVTLSGGFLAFTRAVSHTRHSILNMQIMQIHTHTQHSTLARRAQRGEREYY